MKMIMKYDHFFNFSSNGAPVEWKWQENRSTGGINLSSATLSIINTTWTEPGSNPGLRGGRLATNSLSHGTASHCVTNNPILDFSFLEASYSRSWSRNLTLWWSLNSFFTILMEVRPVSCFKPAKSSYAFIFILILSCRTRILSQTVVPFSSCSNLK
jgi:hypothetical protein